MSLTEDNDNTPLQTNQNQKSYGRNKFLHEYAESRIRPANRQAEATANDIDLGQISPRQREELIEEATDSLRKILVPVAVCLASVVIVISSISFYSRNDGIYLPYTPFHEDGPISNANKLGYAIANSFIIIGVVVLMTMVLVLLYYFRFYKIIHGWLILVSFLVLFIFSSNLLVQIIQTANVSIDYITYSLLTYNFGIMGLMSIHWKSPLKLQQFYLIFTSLLISLVFIKYLPEWTSWVFLIFLATYDIIAVLCPGGPLKMLLKIVQERNEPLMPSLIYTSMAWITTAKTDSATTTPNDNNNAENFFSVTDNTTNNDNPRRSIVNTNEDCFLNVSDGDSGASADTLGNNSIDNIENIAVENDAEDYEVSGVKLGLGDFIFYSVLIGKAAASNDWNTVYACILGILTGLCSTLILLAVSKHALPALPISIAIGVIFYFTTYYAVTPMMDDLTRKMIFL